MKKETKRKIKGWLIVFGCWLAGAFLAILLTWLINSPCSSVGAGLGVLFGLGGVFLGVILADNYLF